MTVVKIENLRLRTVVGVFEWEKKTPQDVVVNVELEIDCPEPARCDSIDDTVDYKKLNKEFISFVEGGKFALIEKIAGGIAEIALAEEKVHRVEVKVDKPGALRFADSVSVTYTAEQSGYGRRVAGRS